MKEYTYDFPEITRKDIEDNYLLEKSLLKEKNLTVSDINKANRIAIMNALMGFYEVENGIIL